MSDAQLIVDVVLNMVDKTMQEVTENTNKTLSKTQQFINNIKKGFDKWTKSIDLSFLSLLFGGMMLKRIFLDTTMSLISGYKEMVGENNVFSKSIDKLTGAFTYFKYELIEGWANSEFVQKAINKITNGLVILGEWFDDHPNVASKLTNLAIAIGAFGASVMVLGEIKQIFGAGGTLATLFKDMGTLLGSKTFKYGATLALTWDFVMNTRDLMKDIKDKNWGEVTKDILKAVADGFLAYGLLAKTNWRIKAISISIGLILKLLTVDSIFNTVTNWFKNLKEKIFGTKEETQSLTTTAIPYLEESLFGVSKVTFDTYNSFSSLNSTLPEAKTELSKVSDELNSQKTIVKDLKDELSNLKNQLESLNGTTVHINYDVSYNKGILSPFQTDIFND